MLQLEQVKLVAPGFGLSADIGFAPGITAILGPSGAGKSTLLSAIAGFWPVAAGRVMWNGSDITALKPAARPVSILFQDNNLFPHLTLLQNTALALEPRLVPSAEACERAEAVLASVGLGHLAKRRPGEVSGGQQSRAALARLLLQDRPVVLLDEAFGALGPALRDEMLDLVAERFDGRTVLMVTHDPADARLVARAIAVVADGRVDPPRDTSECLDHPTPELAAYLSRR